MAKSIDAEIRAQIAKVGKDLKLFEREISKEVARFLADLGADILEDARPLTPYETGQLRNNARAYLRSGGRKQRVAWVEGANSSGGGTVKIGGAPGLSAARNWVLEVMYLPRMKKGFDLTQFIAGRSL